MNFLGLQAQYKRLAEDNATWKLLKATNANFILAFIKNLFTDENELSFGRARVVLDSELQHCRELGIWETETNASTYLNHWIKEGWLREMDDLLTKTDASDKAIRFCSGLDQRSVGTTASHLRIVQEAVRDFAVAISQNKKERLDLLEYKKTEIQQEIDALNAGVFNELTIAEQRERIQGIYQLASALTGDFRHVEDQIRELDQELRVQVIEGSNHRGKVLSSVLEKETLLAKTDAGSAFEGFFQLLCDQNRTTELRDQLRSILSKPIAKQLTNSQYQFLSQLIRELSRESDRVFQVRRRTEESLRAYIENNTGIENRAVDKLIGQLERKAVNLKEAGINTMSLTKLYLPTGLARITSPISMRLKQPDEKLDTTGVVEITNSHKPNSLMLNSLNTVQIKQVALKVRDYIRSNGSMTIASVAKEKPMTSGLEELVAYLRIAKAIGATILTEKEVVDVIDKQGIRLKALIPTYLLSVEQFPDDMDKLII